jgi:hypothetical protein
MRFKVLTDEQRKENLKRSNERVLQFKHMDKIWTLFTSLTEDNQKIIKKKINDLYNI